MTDHGQIGFSQEELVRKTGGQHTGKTEAECLVRGNASLDWQLGVHEGLRTAEGFPVFLQGVVSPDNPGNDAAVRVRKLPFP